MPPPLGDKPRKYCSASCCQRARRPLVPRPNRCEDCAGDLGRRSVKGPPRRVCKDCANARRLAACRAKKSSSSCTRCGVTFEHSFGNHPRFCSAECRWPNARGNRPADCQGCGICFVRRKGEQRYCSRECARKTSAKQATCLRCGKVFAKKRTPAGHYSSSARMYCGRDCAFAHKTERAAWRKLGNWFSDWGEDVWPMLVKCQCGEMHKVSSPSGDQTCIWCRHIDSRRGPCDKCGQEIIRCNGVRFCRECVRKKDRDLRRRARRRRRKTHGPESNYRQRCRKFGVHYEPFARNLIFDRDEWTCQICRCKLLPKFSLIVGTKQVNPRSPTIDHKIPLSEGPSGPGHTPDNCQAACWGCNTERGAKSLDSFAAHKATQLH